MKNNNNNNYRDVKFNADTLNILKDNQDNTLKKNSEKL